MIENRLKDRRYTLANFSRAELRILRDWLPAVHTRSRQYHHLLIIEEKRHRQAALPLMAQYIKRAHEEGVRRFQTFLGDPLDPRRATVHKNALAFYPRYCDEITRQGFYGEIVAGLLAEIYFPHRTRWRVPAFCFYAHELLFQELVTAAAKGTAPRKSLGHFGDDCLAFSLGHDASGIKRILICEAKCTTGHRSSLIHDAHLKLGSQSIEVTTIWLQLLIESLEARADAQSDSWVPALKYYKDSLRFSEQFRRDLISYSHGKRPKSSAKTWINKVSVHKGYRAQRSLEVLEVHFDGVKDLVTEAYQVAYP